MTDRDHAMLEAQRQRSNVYAFRKIKWGDPRNEPKKRQWLQEPRRKTTSMLVTIGLFALLGFLAVVLWLS